MKKLFLFTMICLLGFFSLSAQTESESVKWIKVTDNETSVDVTWSTTFSDAETEDFEAGTLHTRDWKNTSQYPWVITQNAYEGSFAMKSTCEGVDNAVSSIELTVDVPKKGFLSFYHKIGSEKGYDMGNFYVDNEKKFSMSGNKDWCRAEFFVTEGTHVYKWEYVKDSLSSSFDDAYFVDNITFYNEPVPFEGGWVNYDNGEYKSSVGMGAPLPIYWGISFPMTEIYAGLTLSKISMFDSEIAKNATYTANIYLGGSNAPQELVATQKFTTTGSNQFIEVPLSNPVAIDGTKQLWITLYCDELEYPASGTEFVGNTSSDWLSMDGVTWMHATDESLEYSWMIRGFFEDSEGKTRVISSNPTFEGGVSTGKFVAKVAEKPIFVGVPETQNIAKQGRALTKYNLYRKNILSDEEKLLVTETEATEYTDNYWSNAEVGAYKWGVAVVDNGVPTEVLWSDKLDKDMTTNVTVKANVDSGDPVVGTKVNFVNLKEENHYSFTLPTSGEYTIENFRKGYYELTISKEGFTSNIDAKMVEIFDETTFECELKEDLVAVENLYVSPTGWAMWDGKEVGGGDEFKFDFEDSVDGWINIDADKDGYVWEHSQNSLKPGSGHNSNYCMLSRSYVPMLGPIFPDNYLVTEKAYLIGENSQLRFWVCAQDANYSAEHYGVAVSLTGNTSADDFNVIFEETLSAKTSKGATRGTRDQGSWYEKVINLSDYAGQEIYIAFRHFNCTDMFCVLIDDVSLVNADKASRALTSYIIELDGKVVEEDLKTPYYQFEGLTDGQEYTTTVTPVYTMGKGSATSYTWTKKSCSDYEGVTDFTAQIIDGETVISWTLPEVEAKNSSSREGKWLGYDNGAAYDAEHPIGLTSDNVTFLPFQWGIMLPSSDLAEYAGQYLTKVSIYDNEVHSGKINIYKGSASAPETLLHTQDYSTSGTNTYVEMPLTSSVEISGTDNIWVVFALENGKQPAAVCDGLSNANGRWINVYGMWMDNALLGFPFSTTWMMRAYITEENTTVSSSEILGVILYHNDDKIANLAQGEEYIYDNAIEGEEYSLKVVYGGEKDVTYYAMSCLQTINSTYDMPCVAPKNLGGFSTIDNGRVGTMLGWPYIPPTSEWLHYDNGEFEQAIGGPESFYWGLKFPVDQLQSYIGTDIIKVAFYDYAVSSGNVNIYYGGDNAPDVLVHSQPYSATGIQDFVEIELTYPLPITGEENVWVILSTINGANYPAVMSPTINNPDSRWISMDGVTWEDIADSNLDGAWMIRAFVTNEAKGASMQPLETVEFVNTATGGTLMADPNPSKAPTLKTYKIYRGTSLNNMEEIAETSERKYFDEVEKGTYYYQVTAVYEENGETCESVPANSYENPEQDYIVVEVTAIEENGVNGIMVYPNPTDGNLNVTVEAMSRITIVNALGQVVYDREVNSNNEVVNMSQYEAGVYMVRVVTDKGVAVKRIMVL